ncbi:MAG TPA: mechanosensitive ion channel family protein [Kofleriaceae bacterium]|nr:mechanosensitive ion channel family protein [Kofleriaceae bacterium]
MGPGGLEVWQWLGLGVVLVVSVLLGRIGAAVLTWLGGKLAGKTTTRLDDDLVVKLRSPLRFLVGTGVARIGMLPLELPPHPTQIVIEVLQAAFAFGLVWGALRAIDVMAGHLATAQWAATRPSSRSLLSLISRVAKVLVIVIAGIGFLSGIGLPVASLLAGLGIGGIALAFGAQKTVENLFGAVAIGVDQPFREGDFVKVEADTMGTIEVVGLRSTRIRTLERTVISLPNGRLADMRIETFAHRDRIRFATVLNLVYGTSAGAMREVLAELEKVLSDHTGTVKDEITVRFLGFGQSSLDVEVICYFMTADMPQFRAWRQEVLLAFMDIVERKSGFAFPTRTVHMLQSRP